LVSLVKKTTLYAERDEKKRKEFLAAISQYDAADLVYLDESGIDKFLSRDYARSPRGEQVICDVKGRKYQRVSMIAAQAGKAILAPMVFEGTTDSKLFNHWLKECLVPELKPGQIIIMDNYCIHKTAKTKEIIEMAGCKILFLPPYSPDFNPIENTWANIKARIRKIKNSCDDFYKAIDLAFAT
jgi:transposase